MAFARHVLQETEVVLMRMERVQVLAPRTKPINRGEDAPSSRIDNAILAEKDQLHPRVLAFYETAKARIARG